MPDPVPSPPPAAPTQPADSGYVSTTQEMDRAKWNLPPIVPVLIAAAVVAIVIALYTFHASTPMISAKILGAYAAESNPSQILVGVQLSLRNSAREPLWIKDIRVEVKPTGEGADKPPLSDRAAPASDQERYLQAFPDLAAHKMDPIDLDTKLPPGKSAQGMIIVSFPISKDAFDHRQSLKAILDLYDHTPIVIKQ